MRVQVPPGAFVSGRSEVGIAPVLGTGDRKFKPCRSDQPERARKNCPHIIPGSLETEQCDVVSWVYDAPSPSGKAEDFDSSIRRFKSGRPNQDATSQGVASFYL